MKPKVYISGQITGLTQAEYHENFEKAAVLMAGNDFEVVNPLLTLACFTEDCNGDEKKEDGTYLHSWSCYLRHDIIDTLGCEAIALLPNWHMSNGAMLESYVAEKCGLRMFFINAEYGGYRENARA